MNKDPSLVKLTRKPFVRNDLTRRELVKDNELCGELKRRRDVGEDVIIKAGKIVQRPLPNIRGN